ncbi:MAG: gliding motility-associated ABC transporter ATP-binding subunit GldA [Bacteroidota bacterium]
MSIKVNHLIKTFGEQNAVDDITFDAREGEVLGFLGPNGAGKSTTMKIATSYLPPTSGSVEVCGYDVVNDPIAVRKNIGYLPEHNPLYLEMYVHEYLRFVGRLHGIKGKKLRGRVEEMIQMCGLEREQNKKIEALSKGYRQRVGLAQSLIHDPTVLILDEPTSGLDPNQLLEIRNLIKQVSQNKTVIFSTHIMQEVQALCDRVIVIDKGKLVADDPLEKLKVERKNHNLVTVAFTEAVDQAKLEAIEGVIEVIDKGNGSYELKAEVDKDIRPSVFKIASDNNYSLIELKQEEATMENVFHELTRKEDKGS